ncbi:MAG: group-specific protein [Candidatus Saccharibacteria bacterium]|nr:group-specific protein [Candidatus Saccharibacteria bacterium]
MPLNQMESAYPELYEKYVQKYEGREAILQKRIPLLDCLWNDVVQFLPLHPGKIFELQKEFGLISEVPPYKFFQIDLSSLDPAQTVVYFKTAPGEENVSVQWLRDIDFDALQEVPQATVEYYKSLVGTGELPFNYQFVPHILYRGELNIAGVAVITA